MFALELKNLKKTYENGTAALKGIDLQVKKGDFFALLGANGAGKSTTISLISSLLPKSSGEIIINGYSIDTKPKYAKFSLGIVPQEYNLHVFQTCEDVLLNVAGYYGISRKKAYERMNWLLNKLSLEDKKHTIVYQLSGGMKRRLMIARALIHDPKLLILDEPSAGLDVEIRHTIWNFLKEINQLGTTIILTTHYLEEAEQLCNQVAIIHQGEIVAKSSIQELLSNQIQQTYILTSITPLPSFVSLHHLIIKQIDNYSFELTLKHGETLNHIFQKLSEQNISIHTMTLKTNRLEQLFMELIKDEL
jgi:ABC-2 type transport system ATP-binding protein